MTESGRPLAGTRPLIRLVVFDCDGVLVDTEAPSNALLVEMMREVGLDMSVDESNRTFRGRTMPACWQIIEARIGRALPAGFADEFHRREVLALGSRDLAVEGVHEALAGVDALGLETCVASSGEPAKMRVTLGGAGLWQRFEGRIYSAVHDVARGKPHPDVFLHAAEQMGVEPAACVVVEDSPLGVEAGCAAGMQVLGFAREVPAAELQRAGADVFYALAELTGLLAARLGRG